MGATLTETILLEISERLGRIEENQIHSRKLLEGNGKKGLIDRVDSIESILDQARGQTRVVRRILAIVGSVILALAGSGYAMWSNYHKAQLAEQQSLREIDAQHDQQIQAIRQILDEMRHKQ